MTRAINSTTICCALAAVLSTAPADAQPVFDGLEAAEIEACRNDGRWVRDAAVFTYFKDSYYDLDKHFLDFTGTAARRVDSAAAMTDETKRLETYEFLHEQAKGLIPRMGRLLPRMERPLDLKPMIGQMLESAVWDPKGDHYTEYLRVALAREMLAVPAQVARDPGPRIAAFLTYFSVVEDLLLTLKTGAGDEKDVEALKANLMALTLGWRDGFRPIANHAVFKGDPVEFAARLAGRMEAICKARMTCGGDSPEAPMDCGE